MSWILENKDALIGIITGVVALASAIAALTPTPKDDGWVKNPYDECCFNKIVDNSQATFQLFVDDCQISHLQKATLERIVKALNTKFGTPSKDVTVNMNPI